MYVCSEQVEWHIILRSSGSAIIIPLNMYASAPHVYPPSGQGFWWAASDDM